MSDIIQIQDLSLPELRIYDSGSEVQLKRYFEPEPGLFIAESPKVILRALETGYRPVSLLLEKTLAESGSEEMREILEQCGGVPIYTAGMETLTKITGFWLTQGVLCAMRRRRLPGAAEICGGMTAGNQTAGGAAGKQTVEGKAEDEAAGGTEGSENARDVAGNKIAGGAVGNQAAESAAGNQAAGCAEGNGISRLAVLEDITNQTNIGAVFRSAAALGFDAVLLTPGCCDPLYRRSIRVSMGTVFQIPWTWLCPEEMEENTGGELSAGAELSGKRKQSDYGGRSDGENISPAYVNWLKRRGFTTAAMALWDDSVGIDDPRLSAADKLAVILGNEGEGLKETTIRACDYTVKIPMSHGVDSLNVAAASAVAFWELRRR